jgi:hypothetical protein
VSRSQTVSPVATLKKASRPSSARSEAQILREKLDSAAAAIVVGSSCKGVKQVDRDQYMSFEDKERPGSRGGQCTSSGFFPRRANMPG